MKLSICPARSNRIITAALIVVTAVTMLISCQSQSRIFPNWMSLNSLTNKSSVATVRGVKSAPKSAFKYGSNNVANVSKEEMKLQKYMSSRSGADVHRAGSLKAVITILANKRRVNLLKKSVKRLYDHFNSQFGYPVIIFHEADFKPHLEEVRAIGFNPLLNMSSIFFQQIDLSVPSSYLKKFGQPPKDACGGKKSFSYRSMCRFQAKMIYEEPMMRHFDYQWRLDDDSILGKKISFDVFAALRDANCSYGYYQTIIDTCAHNIFDVADSFIKSRRIRPTFFSQLKWNEVFFNNFEVSKIKIWRTKQYRDFVDHVDSLGGIYTYRWGDAPIKTLALSMFLPVSQIYQYTNISYGHHGVSSSLTTILFHNVKSPSVG